MFFNARICFIWTISFFFPSKKAYHMKKNVWALWEWMIFKLWRYYGLLYPNKSTRRRQPVSTVTVAEQCWKQSFCPPAHTVFSNISGSLIKIWRGTDSASLVLTGEWALVQTAVWLQKPSAVLCVLDVSWKWLLSQKAVYTKVFTIYATPFLVLASELSEN